MKRPLGGGAEAGERGRRRGQPAAADGGSVPPAAGECSRCRKRGYGAPSNRRISLVVARRVTYPFFLVSDQPAMSPEGKIAIWYRPVCSDDHAVAARAFPSSPGRARRSVVVEVMLGRRGRVQPHAGRRAVLAIAINETRPRAHRYHRFDAAGWASSTPTREAAAASAPHHGPSHHPPKHTPRPAVDARLRSRPGVRARSCAGVRGQCCMAGVVAPGRTRRDMELRLSIAAFESPCEALRSDLEPARASQGWASSRRAARGLDPLTLRPAHPGLRRRPRSAHVSRGQHNRWVVSEAPACIFVRSGMHRWLARRRRRWAIRTLRLPVVRAAPERFCLGPATADMEENPRGRRALLRYTYVARAATCARLVCAARGALCVSASPRDDVRAGQAGGGHSVPRASAPAAVQSAQITCPPAKCVPPPGGELLSARIGALRHCPRRSGGPTRPTVTSRGRLLHHDGWMLSLQSQLPIVLFTSRAPCWGVGHPGRYPAFPHSFPGGRRASDFDGAAACWDRRWERAPPTQPVVQHALFVARKQPIFSHSRKR
ncbi:hypothetical protein CERSUDRAFT_121925 [Gelatoporia subvermispora B]|uniref:Uncharacterized protein n=1 Tax=Ceriporiopsis subvermispora (strain B) TaxID=914234 RepID=M2RML8_CERS8|nr:hypothetical protein CERSUDRAFT_121925 [Gelatoporia subvermispora B]